MIMAVAEVKGSRKLFSKVSVGCTDFPRLALSFKWVINYAKSLMSCDCELRSPNFNTPHESKNTSLYLLLQQHEVIYYGSYKPCFSISLRFNNFGLSSPSWKIAECTFSLLNCKVKHSVEAKCSTSECECEEFMFKDQLSQLLSGDVLTIQVAASLIYESPVHETYTASSLPVDSTLSGLKKLHRKGSFSDVTIKCSEKEFAAHKAILASQSPVFNRMFETDMKEKSSNVVEVTDIDSNAMSNLLAFLYTGSAPQIDTLAKELLYAASKYEIPLLAQLCQNELMKVLNAGNVLEIIQCADIHMASSLKTACLWMIKCHSNSLFGSLAWKNFKTNCGRELVCEILEFCRQDRH